MKATVKLFNGDLVLMEHTPSKGFSHFVRQIYDICPEIPYGCLVLKRINEDDSKEVREVFDNDELFMFVDTSRIRPVVERGGEGCIPNEKRKLPDNLIQLDIKFLSKKEYDEYGELMCCNQVEIFYLISRNLYALKDTFEEPTLQESSCYIEEGLYPPYRPTDKTIWFKSPIDCLKSFNKPRFPQDQDILQSISEQINLELREDQQDDHDHDDNDHDEN